MKHFIPTIIFLLTTLSNNAVASENTPIIFSGTIHNPESDYIVINSRNDIEIRKAILDSNNSFSISFQAEKAYYKLSDGENQIDIYLKAGDSIQTIFDASDFHNSIIYKGKGAAENNYLAQQLNNDFTYIKLRIALLDETEFLTKADSIQQLKLDFLSSFEKSLDTDFLYVERNRIKYRTLFDKARYQGMHRFYTKNRKFKVSEQFPDISKEVDRTDDKLISLFYYTDLVGMKVKEIVKKKKKQNDSLDYYNTYLDVLASEIESPLIKGELAYFCVNRYLTRSKLSDSLIAKARTLIIDKEQLKLAEDKYRKVKLTEKGAPSPKFIFENTEGKKISLDDLAGKVIYIDIWATWCAPCIREIPGFEKLQQDFSEKEVSFVSISFADNKEKWLKMVEEKELGGIHLFGGESDNPFFANYSVNSIPRYILLDKKLNVITAFAPRPSNAKLINQLNEALGIK